MCVCGYARMIGKEGRRVCADDWQRGNEGMCVCGKLQKKQLRTCRVWGSSYLTHFYQTTPLELPPPAICDQSHCELVLVGGVARVPL